MVRAKSQSWRLNQNQEQRPRIWECQGWKPELESKLENQQGSTQKFRSKNLYLYPHKETVGWTWLLRAEADETCCL